ncbi:hypothetical protein GOODEAATRI_019464 [Goodea atripinnis]|uniref:Uncharacterized protein n=1 Tax=Goodea atripinnis TaxID=208336 RepID=A0ABV0MJ58_9TELE
MQPEDGSISCSLSKLSLLGLLSFLSSDWLYFRLYHLLGTNHLSNQVSDLMGMWSEWNCFTVIQSSQIYCNMKESSKEVTQHVFAVASICMHAGLCICSRFCHLHPCSPHQSHSKDSRR